MENSEEKIKERALLLMRLYWKDGLFKIGKELNISYFNQFRNYWDIDEDISALEISKDNSDENLFKIIKENPPPKYRFSYLGGFQGKYYTATKKGEVKLQSSWEEVNKNLQEALNKWRDNAYGVLQAMINKNGTVVFFDLVDEIEKVIGREYFPTILLPRLQTKKLVFKTGSNKYPDWTIPHEIIPLLKEKLADYKKSKKIPDRFVKITDKGVGKDEVTVIRKTVESIANIVLTDKTISEIADKIVDNRRDINLIFSHKFGEKLFKGNESAVLDIRKVSKNEEDFNNRIQSLTTLIDGTEVEKLKELTNIEDSIEGSINILEIFLQRKFPNYNQQIITNLRNIATLRSKKYPIHEDRPELIDALNFFGFRKFPPVWGEVWETVLKKYSESLEALKKVFQD